MAAQSLASRSRDSHRKHSDDDDVIVARAVELSVWARNNARLVIGIAVVVLVAVGGFLYYRWDRANMMERAASEFMQLEQTVIAGNTELALRDLELFAERYAGTPYADEAVVILGRLHLQAGNPQAAVQTLNELAGDIGDSPMGASAALLLATAQNAGGNPEQAIQTYLRVADSAPAEYQRQEALGSAAMLREQAGDFAGAAELYRRLVESAEEGSLQQSVYQMRLAEAEARAESAR